MEETVSYWSPVGLSSHYLWNVYQTLTYVLTKIYQTKLVRLFTRTFWMQIGYWFKGEKSTEMKRILFWALKRILYQAISTAKKQPFKLSIHQFHSCLCIDKSPGSFVKATYMKTFSFFHMKARICRHFEPKQSKSSVAFSTNRLLKQISYLGT